MAARNILIVEDMPDWRDQLESTLRRDGYTITTVANYGEALGELRRNEYQLVIVDLRLSPSDENNRDGMILLRDLAALKVPAIVLTGYGTAELARRAFRNYGILDFLEKKDLELKKLRHVVKEAFRQADEMEKELAGLRTKFLRGEIITFPQDRLARALGEKPAEYGG
jgi:two-component system nitrogen regulation response regulator NtrX